MAKVEAKVACGQRQLKNDGGRERGEGERVRKPERGGSERERKIPGNVAEKYGEKCEMKHARNMLQMFRIIVCHLIALWHNLIAAAQQQQQQQPQQLKEQLLNRLLTE